MWVRVFMFKWSVLTTRSACKIGSERIETNVLVIVLKKRSVGNQLFCWILAMSRVFELCLVAAQIALT